MVCVDSISFIQVVSARPRCAIYKISHPERIEVGAGRVKISASHTHTHTHRQRTTPPTPSHTHTRQEQHPKPPNEHLPQTLNNARKKGDHKHLRESVGQKEAKQIAGFISLDASPGFLATYKHLRESVCHEEATQSPGSSPSMHPLVVWPPSASALERPFLYSVCVI